MKTLFPVRGHFLLAAALSLGAPTPFVGAEPAAPFKKPVVKVDSTPVTEGKAPVLVSYADMLDPVQKAVVSVSSTRNLRRRAAIPPFPWMPRQPEGELQQKGVGSGVIVTADGFVLTNHHVVEGADELTVKLTDDREFKARVVGTDPKTDIAVIKVDADDLPTVTLADSDKVRVGDIVFAVGNPLDVGQTVTMGLVSAKGRSLGILRDVEGYENFIQTDAAINQGNSGGALVDAKGRLVGINSAILSPTRGNIGIGFSIPTNLARGIMDSLIETGKVTRGFLGVQVQALAPDDAESLGLKKDAKGVVVMDLTPPDSPAERAGIRRYDVILAINGKPLVSYEELRLHVAQFAPDTEITLKIFRDGKDRDIKVKLGRLPGDGLATNELLPGVKAARPTPEQRKALDLDNRVDGLLITEVADDSPYHGRLLPNMVIIDIARSPVTDVEAAKRLIVSGPNLFAVYYRGAIRLLAVVVK